MTKQTLRITGMHCVGCAMTIDGAVEDLDGVRSASTHYARQEVIVEWDEKRVSLQDIIGAIQSAGYGVVSGPAG